MAKSLIHQFISKSNIKYKIKKYLGIDISIYTPYNNSAGQTISAINRLKIDEVIDVGANIGQFALELRNLDYKGKITSFEPLSSAHQILTRNARNDKNWNIYKRVAIGAEICEEKINISKNSQSSSILNMLELHKKASPGAVYKSSENVEVITLDSVFCKNHNKKSYFLKIDTQGYEWNVLKGAENLLENCKAICCELSLEKLYSDQKDWLEIIKMLEKKGFELWSLETAYVDSRNGKLLQMDGIFIKSPS